MTRLVLVIAMLLLTAPSITAEESDPEEARQEWIELGLPPDLFSEYTALQDLLHEKKVVDAEREARALLARMEQEHGTESLEAALALDCVVQALHGQGMDNQDEILELIERDLRIKRAELGEDHRSTMWTMTVHAYVLDARGEFDASLEVLMQSVEIVERSREPGDFDIARAYDAVGTRLRLTGRYEESKEWHLRAVEIVDANDEVSDRDRASTWNNLALAYELLAEYDEARALHEKTLALRESMLSPDHPELAQSHTNLAILEAGVGNMPAAVAHFEKSLEINRKAFGEVHPQVASDWNNLAVMYSVLGDYLAAREGLERSLEIRQELLGESHWATAQSRFNLAAALYDLGDYEEAVPLFREALAVQEVELGATHARVAMTLNALGTLLADNGDPAAAIPLHERAAAIWSEAVGIEHPDWATAQHSLGSAYLELGELEQAEQHLTLALEVRMGSFGPSHHKTAATAGELGVAVRRLGRAEEALDLHNSALVPLEVLLGDQHPEYARELRRRADAYADLDWTADAFVDALAAEEIARANTRTIVRGLSERRAMRWLDKTARGLPLLVRLAAETPDDTQRVRATWDALIRARATVLGEMAARRQSAARLTSAEDRAAVEHLAQLRRRYANLVLRGPGDDPPEDWARLVDETRREKEATERELAERTNTMADSSHAGLENVLDRLPEGAALVAYARWETEQRDGYAAFVAGGADPEPAIVPLGSAGEVDDAIEEWHGTLGAGGGRGVHRAKKEDSDRSTRPAGRSVRELVWDDVSSRVAGAEIVFLVPDGALHFVAFDALPEAEAGWLAESAPLFHTLSAERELAAPEPGESGDGLLAIGGPDFDGATGAPAETTTVRGERVDCEAVRALRFLVLPGAEQEADDVVAVWSRAAEGETIRLSGAAATESAVKSQAPGRRGLHLATHGFVLDEGCGSPLLHAGLALAGANLPEPAAGSEEDGILTAEEIASLPLDGLEWVVLSACETGLGGVHAGEGILGLRRAFETAGAQTLVTSLWSVDDVTTRRWMSALYEARFARGLGAPEAIRRANLELLRARREEGGSTHPAHWTGFVASGDWR